MSVITAIETAHNIAYYLGIDNLTKEQYHYIADLIEFYASEAMYRPCSEHKDENNEHE